MDGQVTNGLLEKYEKAKSDYNEIVHRPENKRTAGQVIRAEERYKSLEEILYRTRNNKVEKALILGAYF